MGTDKLGTKSLPERLRAEGRASPYSSDAAVYERCADELEREQPNMSRHSTSFMWKGCAFGCPNELLPLLQVIVASGITSAEQLRERLDKSMSYQAWTDADGMEHIEIRQSKDVLYKRYWNHATAETNQLLLQRAEKAERELADAMQRVHYLEETMTPKELTLLGPGVMPLPLEPVLVSNLDNNSAVAKLPDYQRGIVITAEPWDGDDT